MHTPRFTMQPLQSVKLYLDGVDWSIFNDSIYDIRLLAEEGVIDKNYHPIGAKSSIDSKRYNLKGKPIILYNPDNSNTVDISILLTLPTNNGVKDNKPLGEFDGQV